MSAILLLGDQVDSEGHTGCRGFKAFFRVFTKCGTCPSFSASDSTMTLSLLSLVSLTTCLVRPSCAVGRPCLQEPGNSGAHPLQISAHPVSSLSSGAWQTYYQVLCACFGLAPARCSQVEFIHPLQRQQPWVLSGFSKSVVGQASPEPLVFHL